MSNGRRSVKPGRLAGAHADRLKELQEILGFFFLKKRTNNCVKPRIEDGNHGRFMNIEKPTMRLLYLSIHLKTGYVGKARY